MLEFLRPGLLAAGALAALLPLLLHLIVRRPPERAPLPTLRFLRPDPRTALRLRRRPSDLPLLLLRMLLLLLVGAALAGPLWRPRLTGTAEVVLLERSAAMANGWESTVAQAWRLLLSPAGEVRGELVLFDSVADPVPRARLTPGFFDSLAAAAPAGAPPDYTAALRAIPAAAGRLDGADSVRVHLLASLRWEGWRPGLGQVRRAAWPGALQLAPAAAGDAAASSRAAAAPEPIREPRQARVIAAPGGGRFVEAALGALGWSVARQRPDALPAAEPADAYLLLTPVPPPLAAALAEAVGEGATVVHASGALPPADETLPWEAAASAVHRGSGTLYFDPELVIAGAVERLPGRPGRGARVIAAWEDGRPAAAAERRGAGCVVFLATPLEGGTLPFTTGYPLAVARLARGCEAAPASLADTAPGAMRLDEGALSVLRGDDLPARVEVDRITRAAAGVPMGRWVLLAALGVALLETLIVYVLGRTR